MEGELIDASAAFECRRVGHVPTITFRSVFVASWACQCVRCGRVVEFAARSPIRVDREGRS
jgi:hypothetical protein